MSEYKIIKRMLDELDEQMDKIAGPFEYYIKNQQEPLEERWELFSKACMDMKNHEGFIHHFKCIKGRDAEMNLIGEDGLYYASKGKTIETDVLADFLKEYVNHEEYEHYFPKNFSIDILKEEILQKNLGSYEYDW